jgi:hypothetical protein
MEWSKEQPCCYEINVSNHQPSFVCGKFYTSLLPEKYKEKDGHYYCFIHLKKTIQQMVKEEKEEIKKQKSIEKQKLKEEKIKLKELEKKKMSKKNHQSIIVEENIILSKENVLKCKSIVKSGLNKGENCSFHLFQDGFCKRHYQIEMKKVNEKEIIL